MSETLPGQPLPEQPEVPIVEPKQRIQASCWSCNHVVTSALANCQTTVFCKQPWNSYTSLTCRDTRCAAVTILFHDQVSQETAARAVQYPTTIAEFCDQDDILDIRRDVVGAQAVESHGLSDRLDRIIDHWGQFLQSTVVDLSDFPEAPPSPYR